MSQSEITGLSLALICPLLLIYIPQFRYYCFYHPIFSNQSIYQVRTILLKVTRNGTIRSLNNKGI